jgi:hypothetical protein
LWIWITNASSNAITVAVTTTSVSDIACTVGSTTAAVGGLFESKIGADAPRWYPTANNMTYVPDWLTETQMTA